MKITAEFCAEHWQQPVITDATEIDLNYRNECRQSAANWLEMHDRCIKSGDYTCARFALEWACENQARLEGWK